MSKRMAPALIALLPVLAAGQGAQADLLRHAMSGEAIRAELSGKNTAGVYPSQMRWTEFLHADGRSDYKDADAKLDGMWTIRGDLQCFDYPSKPLFGACFKVVKRSSNCYENWSVGPDGERAVPTWNGLFWRTEVPDTCEERPTS